MTETSSWKQKLLAGMAALALIGTAACARAADNPGKKADGKAATKAAPKDAPKEAAKGGQTVQMKVTDKGFEPAAVTVEEGRAGHAGHHARDGRHLRDRYRHRRLRHQHEAAAQQGGDGDLHAQDGGDLKYGCAMGKMIGGVLKVQ